MTNDLAALSEAATQGANPMLLECVENGVWQLRLIFGVGADACHAMRKWSDAYRAGRLVLIDREGMRDKLWSLFDGLMCGKCGGEGKIDGKACDHCDGSGDPCSLHYADAAIAAILGEKPV